jgi:hypothetical protein
VQGPVVEFLTSEAGHLLSERRLIGGAFFAITTDTALLVVIQILDGLTGATLRVLTTLVIADLVDSF